MVAIKTENLSKDYGEVLAVDSIDLEIEKGELFGLLGPNGAGKTTTVGMLTSEVKPTSGKAFVNGIDVVKRPLAVKNQIGVIPQHRSLDRRLTGRENVEVMANAYGIENKEERIDEVLEMIDIENRADESIMKYSGGMLQRILIARSLVHDPDVIFLDEPTMGLDPQVRKVIWQKIKDLNKEGKTFLLTTHYMEEADELCDRVAIMNEGKVIKTGVPEHLKEQDTTQSVFILGLTEVPDALIEEIKEIDKVKEVKVKKTQNQMEMYVYSENGHQISPRILDAVNKRKLTIHSLDLREPTLEDVFTNLTGERLK